MENVPQSRNVIENKDSYASKAGMSLKRKGLGGARAGFRIQESGVRMKSSAFRFLPSAYCRLPTPTCDARVAQLTPMTRLHVS